MSSHVSALARPLLRVVAAAAAVASRAVNAVFYRGSMHQSLSARAHVEQGRDPVWAARRRRIDRLFSLCEERHCANAWADEVYRARRTLEMNEATGPYGPSRPGLPDTPDSDGTA